MTVTAPDRPAPVTRITVMQGEARVSASPEVELTTVLGSCVATCLYEPDLGLGGMNHFLLAEPHSRQLSETIDEHYGVYLMEVLINEMMAQGANRSRLRAHLYGGANMRAGMTQIGTMNAEFARTFLARERIPLLREDLGGTNARRVDFRPVSGQVRCRIVENALAPEPKPASRGTASTGEVELFQ